MGLWECLLLAIGLSMDAMAVSFSKGLAMSKFKLHGALSCGLWFGFFQAAMPLVGYFLANRFAQYVEGIDHWIAFVLLAMIGVNMIRESRGKDADEAVDIPFGWKRMLPLAIATSIDALAIGVTFAFLKVEFLIPILMIGVTTFLLSAIAVCIGTIFGTKFASRAEMFGGIVLVLLGIKTLLQGLEVFH